MDVLDPEKIKHKNLCFKEDTVKSLCDTLLSAPRNSSCVYCI